MKNLKRIIKGVLLFAFIILLTGCFSKKALSSEDFKTKMEEKGFTVQDATHQLSSYSYINKVYLAISSNSTYQIEFYDLATEDDAINFFNNNKSLFEKSKSNDSGDASSNVNLKNYTKYVLISGGRYKVVSRINNTVIYLNVEETNKDEVKQILKDLGY